MLRCYTQNNGQLVEVAWGLGEARPALVWIDLLNPTPEEDAIVEGYLSLSVPTRAEMADAAHYFYADPTHAINVPTKFAEVMTDPVRSALPELLAAFESVEWSREAIGATIKSVAAKRGLKTSQLMMAARALVTGEPQTPPIDAVLALVGREHVVDRLRRGLAG